MMAVIPSMRNTLAMLDPRTFPIAISVLPSIPAMIDTTSSGILVPIATIVSPIIASEIENLFASDTAPSTSMFQPKVRTTNQIIMTAMAMMISIWKVKRY